MACIHHSLSVEKKQQKNLPAKLPLHSGSESIYMIFMQFSFPELISIVQNKSDNKFITVQHPAVKFHEIDKLVLFKLQIIDSKDLNEVNAPSSAEAVLNDEERSNPKPYCK